MAAQGEKLLYCRCCAKNTVHEKLDMGRARKYWKCPKCGHVRTASSPLPITVKPEK